MILTYYNTDFLFLIFFFFNDTATTEIYTTRHTLSLHDALPISYAVQHPGGNHGFLSRSRSASSLRRRRSSSSLRFLSETSWVRSSSGEPSNTFSTRRRNALRPAAARLTSGL